LAYNQGGEKKISNKILFINGSLIATILISLMLILPPTHSWVYQDGTVEDTKFEKFGPRADRLLIKLGATAETLENGEVDISDLSVTGSYYDSWTSPPYNETINVISYGPDYSFYMLDINNANITSSPVYPNPLSVLSFRQAVAHLVDRAWLVNVIGPLWFIPIWVPMSPAMGKYYLNMTNPYPYNLTATRNLLDLDGFPVNSTTGWRFWDRNGNGVEEPEERLELKFVIRSDHAHRRIVGDKIADDLAAVNVRVHRIYVDQSGAYTIVNVNRDFHLYTGGYNVGPDPRYLYDCFHSSQIPQANYNGINDTGLDYWLEMLIIATTQEEAVNASHNAQKVFVNKSFKVPLWAYHGYKAMYRRYTGGTAGNPVTPDDGENTYRNITWQGAVNIPGSGIDNYFSFLNMHPTGYERERNTTIRYGCGSMQLDSLNPIYASSPSDWQVLDLIYDRLVKYDPYNTTEWMPWIAKNFTVGTYTHPTLGTCTKITITLPTDVTWLDGSPFTLRDVYFTLVEIDDILEKRGYPPPWWAANVKDILSFSQLDPYNFEVLFRVTGYWALSCIGSVPILPEHIWRPIVQTGDPAVFAPDPNMISSGPWRFREYVAAGYVDLVANKLGRTIQTGLPGSTPITSPQGYFRYHPIMVTAREVGSPDWRHKFDKCNHTLEVTLFNEHYYNTMTVDKNVTITFANGTTVVLAQRTGISILPRTEDKETWAFCWPYGVHDVEVSYHITGPAWVACTTKKVTLRYWVTIKEDIGGAMQDGVTAPDIRVEGKDIAVASKAFGTKPGDARWSAVADVTGDYRVEGKDMARLAKMFGWRPVDP